MSFHRTLAGLLCASALAISGCATSPPEEPEEEDTSATSDEKVGEAKDDLKACWGDDSCNQLFGSGACPGSAVCFESGSGSSYKVMCVCN